MHLTKTVTSPGAVCKRRQTKYPTLLLILWFLITLCVAFPDWKLGTGFGLQYGGVVGIQGSYSAEHNKYNLGLGLYGVSLGYDRFLDNHHTLGIHSYLGIIFGVGLSWNYYMNGKAIPGWRFGLEVGVASTLLFSDAAPGRLLAFPSIGYHF